jgi:hypothetical protein
MDITLRMRRGCAMSDGPTRGRLVYRMKRSRARAARCEEQASLAENPTQQETFLRAAAAWTKIADDLAEELERN